MDHRPLGRTGLSVSALSLGTMTFGEQNDEAEGHAQLDMALEAGIDLIDTAEMYPVPPCRETATRTEAIIGSWLKARPSARDKVVIATKAAGRSDTMTWLRAPERPVRLSAEQLREAVEGSLKRLSIDRIDLYQLHWPERPMPGFGGNATVFAPPEAPADAVTPVEEQLEALARLVEEGKIGAVGLSNESTYGLAGFLAVHEFDPRLPRIASIQNAYSLVNRTFEVNLAEACLAEDVSLLGYSPLAQGYLTGKYRDGALPEGARKTLFDRLQRYEGPGGVEAIDAYCDLAAEAGLDPARMAIAFALSRPFMTSVILGATSTEQLAVALSAADLVLPEDLLARIDTLHRSHANPCP